MKALKNLIKLSSQVKIYVPSTVNIDGNADQELVDHKVNSSLAFLASIFGGSTASTALGAWVTQKGELVKENVTIVFAFAKQSLLEENIEKIYDFCLNMKQDMRQEAIALEINGELYFV